MGKEKMMNLRASCHSARYQRVPWGKRSLCRTLWGKRDCSHWAGGCPGGMRRKEDPMRVTTAHTLPIALVKALGVGHQP